MLIYIFATIAAAGVFAGGVFLAALGVRNGDLPGDAKVTARLRTGAQPDEPRPVIVVTVHNPSGTPVLAGLSARRGHLRAGLAGQQDVSVPWLTARRKFRPDLYDAVGVVPEGGTAELTVPAPVRSRRWRLVVAVGQRGGRLRVYRLRLGPGGPAAAGATAPSTTLLP